MKERKTTFKKKGHLHKKKALFLFFFYLFLFVNHSYPLNLPYINKAKIRASVIPGQQIYGDIIIENPNPQERPMRLYLEDWQYLASGDGAKEFMPVSTLANSCASWIIFSPAEFTIPAFGRQRVSYTIKAPQDASGGYYAALFFESLMGKIGMSEKETGAGLDLTVRIASLFYVEAAGAIKRTAEIDNLTLKKDAPGGLSIQLDFNNTGNTDITCGGTFHLMDKNGMIPARGEFANVYTFAGGKAKLKASWKETIPKGNYALVLTFDLGKAQEEVKVGRGPVIVKETEIEIGEYGQVVAVGKLE